MFECLREATTSNLVLKKDLERITGGILSSYSIYNPAYKNEPLLPEPIKVGSKTAYDINEIIAWLEYLFNKEFNDASPFKSSN